MRRPDRYGRPPNRRPFPYRKPVPAFSSSWRNRFGYVQAMLLTLGVSVGGLIGLGLLQHNQPATLECPAPEVLDGDTFDCGMQRVRLYGIDAPELSGHCRRGRDCAPGDPYASTENLRRLVAGSSIQCWKKDTDVYGRMVARCSRGGEDLSCAQIDGGFAIRRYGTIWC